MRRLPLSEIGLETNFYPRANAREDWITVHKYRDALAADSDFNFPPIVVVAATAKAYRYMILDGLHRCKAYALAGREKIPAEVERLPESKWFARSAELNAAHGRPLDSGDKAWITLRLQKDGFSLADAAKLLHMRPESLEKIMAERPVKLRGDQARDIPEGRGNRRVNGHHYGFLKSPFKGFTGTATAGQALAVQGPVSARDALHVLDSAIAVLECGVDGADAEIAPRLARLRELLSN